MAIPGLLYFFINNYLPMFGTIIAFKNINFSLGFIKSPWAGLQNFRYLFSSGNALVITRNTILYNAVFIVSNLIFPVMLAILLNEIKNPNFKKFSQTTILIPYLISMVIVGYLGYAFLSGETGFLNKTIFPIFGLNAVSWYMETKYWPFILSFINIWKNSGYYCIIYYAALLGLDQEIYEAATIDGANKIQQIFKITIPLIKPIIITMVVLQIGRIFYSDFGLFYQVPMNSGILLPVTNVIDTYVYRGLMQMGNIGMSAAAGFYQSIVGFVLVLLSNLFIKKFSPENSIF
jgi:putative aldouronate transport system permease protein